MKLTGYEYTWTLQKWCVTSEIISAQKRNVTVNYKNIDIISCIYIQSRFYDKIPWLLESCIFNVLNCSAIFYWLCWKLPSVCISESFYWNMFSHTLIWNKIPVVGISDGSTLWSTWTFVLTTGLIEVIYLISIGWIGIYLEAVMSALSARKFSPSLEETRLCRMDPSASTLSRVRTWR